MNVAVVYCCPTAERYTYLPFAKRFARSWLVYPPGFDHKFYIMVNGLDWPKDFRSEFAAIPHHYEFHDNVGWDIGAFQRAANVIPCDLLVCLGAHICFNHDNWLKTIVDAYAENGPGLYGPWGAMFPTVHVRTTAFWCPPELLMSYPFYIQSDRKSRYGFEHGQDSFTKWTRDCGFPVYMLTTKGCFEVPQWEQMSPTAEESIMLDKQHKGL